MKSFKILLLIIAAALFVSTSYSQPGQLDMSFGNSGKALTLVNGRSYVIARDMMLQPDNKILIAGETIVGENDLVLIRFNADGTKDKNFGLNGLVQIDFSESYRRSSGALQENGKIIIGGILVGAGAIINRFNSNGTPDSSFGINGTILLEDSENTHYFLNSLDIQNDGKIVIAGEARNGWPETFFARFNVNGSLDQDFGDEGIVILEMGGLINYVNTVKVQPDGKIIAAGKIDDIDIFEDKFLLVRLTPLGVLDNTFGINGTSITSISRDEEAEDLVIQPDGKYLITGYSINNEPQGQNNWDITLIRYNNDGSLDNNFGVDGIKTIDPTGNNGGDKPNSLALQSDGKILVTGSTIPYDPDIDEQYIFIIRTNQFGVLDNSFNSDGIVVVDFGTNHDDAYSIKESNDGKIIISASELTTSSWSGYSNILQYNSDGTTDEGFGENGMARVKAGVFDAEINSLLIQNDGKIIAAGESDNYYHTDFSMVRYNYDGTLDNTFGNEGIVITEVGDSYSHAHSMGMQSDGKFILAGYAIKNGNNDFAVARYLPNGFLDNTFGTDGIVTTSIGAEDYAFSAVVQSDDKIILGGSTAQNQFDFALVRYNPDGSLDTQFGNNGIVTTQIGNAYDQINSLAIQSDGKIVAAGHSNIAGATDFTLARYNENGTLDNTFSDDGKVVTSVSTLSDRINSVKIQNDNKIVAAGYHDNGSDDDFAISRYDENGILDNNFGTNGIVKFSLGSGDDRIESIEITDENKIIAAGYTEIDEEYYYAIARFNSDGSLDTSFGNNGIMTTSFGISNDFARAVAIQEDGKIIAAGKSDNFNDYALFSLARFHGDGTTDIGDDLLNKTELDFRLSQNYPNPFNPITTIKFVIPAVAAGHTPSTPTKLIVFDILGNKVSTLINGSKQPGTYEVEFNAEHLPSGVYFYILSTGTFTKTKKMLVLK